MSFEKKRNQNLKYEDVKDDNTYTFNLNPEDAFQFWDSPDRYNEFKKHHINYLKKLTIHDRVNVFTLDINIEFSPLGRLHFHGYIKILNKRKFYEYVVRKLGSNCQFEIDVINDHEVWQTYKTKQDLDAFQIGHDFKIMTKDFFTKQSGNQENL